MKTSAINNGLNNKNNKIAFKGHTAFTTDTGFKRHKFYIPYDNNRFDAKIEFRSFVDKNGEWVPNPDDDEVIVKNLTPNGIQIRNTELFTDDSSVVGYRYVLSPKDNPSQKIYKIDSGTVTNPLSKKADKHFTILHPNRNVITDNGLTKQVMPDILPGYKFEYGHKGTYEIKFDENARTRATNGIRTHANKLGGNFAGIAQMLGVWEREGYTKLVGTPFTKDEVSSHLYWTENPYQVANTLGSLRDFKTLQKELFKHGMNFIADGAFVNQGLQGVLFKNLLKHGEQSPFFHWFKASGILSGDFKLGAIPRKEKARENFRFRLVNAPVNLVEKDGMLSYEKNREYDSSKTSYLQLYDKRLVTQKELDNRSELLTRYSITNTKNPYEITGHDDTTQLLSFEINPKDYASKLIKTLKSTPENKRSFQNRGMIESLLTFPNYRITTKDKGGFDLWDGNMDIAKLSFYIGNTDNLLLDRFENIEDKEHEKAKMQKAVYQVQDFTLGAGKYWTKLVADTQLEYIANTLNNTHNHTTEGYKKLIHQAVEKGALPKKAEEVMTETVISNVLNRNYNLERNKKDSFEEDHWVTGYLKQRIMDFPLESIEFAPDLNGVIASPFISKRATNELELNQTRLEIFAKQSKDPENIDPDYAGPYQDMDNLLAGKITDFAKEIIVNLNEELNQDYDNANVPEGSDKDRRIFNIERNEDITEFGKYVMPLILPEIIKFAMVKGLDPDAHVEFDKKSGQILYDEDALRKISLKTIGADGSPKDEAATFVNKLDKGVTKLLKEIEKQNNVGIKPGEEDEKADENSEVIKLSRTLQKRVSRMSINGLRLAEAMMDKTESGLGWRIDAAKDIGNIDAIRTGNDSDERLLHQISDFWKRFNDTVKAQNKHAYTTAEITDFQEVVKSRNGVFKNDVHAESKFIEKSGLNNTANYMFFYSMLKNLFALSAETGREDNFNNIQEFKDKLTKGWGEKCHGFLFQYPDDSIANSYTFVGNHDKPRVLHIFALDMGLFHSDFTNSAHRETAKTVLRTNSTDEIDVYSLSGKAVAMGSRILKALEETNQIKTIKKEDNETPNEKALKESIAELSKGIYDGEKFNPDAFGARDFRHAVKDVFDIAQKKGYKSEHTKENIDKVLENILTPAMDKMESVYKMLVTLPGSPTDFVGDKEGSSGYETKSNNEFQQNRNVVPFEWINGVLMNPYMDKADESKAFAEKYYVRMTQIGNLRNKKELSALRNGNTIALPMQHGIDSNGVPTQVAATYRYDDKGSQVICLYTTAGANSDNSKTMNRPCVNMEKITLDTPESNWKEGIKGGLKVGDTFLKVNEDGEYKVFEENGQYVLRRINNKGYRHISITPEDKNTAVFYKKDPSAYNTIMAHMYNPSMLN